MQRRLTLLAILIPVFLAACSLLAERDNNQVTTPSPTPATPSATAVPEGADDLPAPVTISDTVTTLTVWLPPELDLDAEQEFSSLSQQITAFGEEHPDLITRVEYKTVSGQGGILSYLRTGRTVAPSVLPDLVALPTDQLTAAAAEELVFPLETLLDPAMLEDLYPAARSAAQYGEHVVGYPFALTQLPHLAYDNTILTDTLPLTWEQFVADANGRLLFPAAGKAGATLALQFYLAAGGSLVNQAGQATLEVDPLVAALTQLSEGRTTGLILLQSSNVVTLSESWLAFQSGSATIVQTTADQFMRERASGQSPGFAPIPGPGGPVTPLVEGWVWTISTPDPARKALAVELLSALASSASLGEWSLRHEILPARRQSFSFWPADDPYVHFLQQELERAQLMPVSVGSKVMASLSDAVFDVITLAKTPQVAAEEAAAQLQP